MTADELRAAIARDCPHRLPDYDRHLAGHQPTEAFIRLWRIEHAISSTGLEARIRDLYRQAQDSRDITEGRALLAEASRIRREAAEGLK